MKPPVLVVCVHYPQIGENRERVHFEILYAGGGWTSDIPRDTVLEVLDDHGLELDIPDEPEHGWSGQPTPKPVPPPSYDLPAFQMDCYLTGRVDFPIVWRHQGRERLWIDPRWTKIATFNYHGQHAMAPGSSFVAGHLDGGNVVNMVVA